MHKNNGKDNENGASKRIVGLRVMNKTGQPNMHSNHHLDEEVHVP